MYRHSSAKRAFDIVVTLVLLVVALPFMLFVAIGVALSSPGPIIYRQERIGRFGRPFTIYKFRSMWFEPNALFIRCTDSDDPRVTGFGRFIRRTHVDELPQMFNVLKGDMSLVGPRPLHNDHETQLSTEFPHASNRRALRPGITGPGRLGRGVSDWGRELALDHQYLENPSVWKDIVILAQTIPMALFGRV